LLSAIMALGMVGVLFLNTAIQSLSSQARSLSRQAAMLGYQMDALQVQVNQLRSTTMLAQQATAMGMAPNPFAAIIMLPSGEISGDLRQVWGWELGDQLFAGDEKAPELPTPRVITSPRPPTWDIGWVEKTKTNVGDDASGSAQDTQDAQAAPEAQEESND
jgi:hypothetical protein